MIAPLVTAIITTHRRPAECLRALASLNRETFQDFECVIAEDGTGLRLEQLTRVRADVRLVQQQQAGVAAVRNLGLGAARGRYVIFLDDDDVALPNRIETLLAAARCTGSSMSYGLALKVLPSGEALQAVPTHPLEGGTVGYRDVLTCMPHIDTVLVERAMLRASGGFDPRAVYFDDWAAWLHLMDRGTRATFTNEIVALFQVHDAGLTGEVRRGKLLDDRIRLLLSVAEASHLPQHRSLVRMHLETLGEQPLSSYDAYVETVRHAHLRPSPRPTLSPT